VYLVDESLEHPVLQSQTLSVLARLIETGLKADILIANGASASREEGIARSILGEGPRVLLLSKRHRGSSPLAKARRAISRTLAYRRAARLVTALHASGEALVLHARGSALYLGAALRRSSRTLRLVADLRGDAAAEARFNLGGAAGERRAKLVERMDARALAVADHVLCVSGVLLSEVRERFAINCPATVIPCVADERRFFPDPRRREDARQSLDLGPGPVIAYAGSIGQWHRFDAIVEAFDAVARANGAARFLIATRQTEEANRLLSDRPVLHERTRVRHGDADEVARWLNAADVGVLLRDPHPLNRVACPTKFAEYALSGLRVVVSGEIGDLGPWVRDLDLGACIRGASASEAAEACLRLVSHEATSEDRVGRVRRAAPVLAMGSRLDDWASAYQAVMKQVAG
jgi:glycosyltransferase involved in cell wall biosynthesis